MKFRSAKYLPFPNSLRAHHSSKVNKKTAANIWNYCFIARINDSDYLVQM